MRIEKVNDNQIRCTLTKEDLLKRNLRISELAYGSDKAKLLFRDMMQQAALQFGFNAENIPIMIEAIPMNSECIVLIVTKVEDPEELDTRYSNFAPSVQNESLVPQEDSGGSLLDQLMRSIGGISFPQEDTGTRQPALSGKAVSDAPAMRSASSEDQNRDSAGKELQNIRMYVFTHRLFLFSSVSDAAEAAGLTNGNFHGHSAFYRDPEGGYCLVLVFGDAKDVMKSQNALAVLSEYGTPDVMSYAREQFLMEHCEVILSENALGSLAAVAAK